jgi:2-methylisocitrate lyase-like PEP mutase family enzyme
MSKTQLFSKLHIPGNPLILFNMWDVGSAFAVTKGGAKALATGSWGVAAANGYADGEAMPLAAVLDNVARIVAATDLPVTLDFETAYGTTPDDVAHSVQAAANTGIVGINLEDQIIGGSGLRPIAEQALRIAAAAKSGLFINARTDLFIKTPADQHDSNLVAHAIERAHAYAAAGAQGFFAPFLKKSELIAQLCAASPLPVNIMLSPDSPSVAMLKELGVARISYGPNPYRQAMAWLEAQAKAAHEA